MPNVIVLNDVDHREDRSELLGKQSTKPGRLVSVCSILLLGTVAAAPVEQKQRDSKFGDRIANGSLDIRVHPGELDMVPPVELCLTDPQGAKTGRDPTIDRLFSEIPDSSYESESIADNLTGAPGPETKILYLKSPLSGQYTLWVIGKEFGRYHLEIRGHDEELNPSHVRFLGVMIGKDERHKYRIHYTGQARGKIAVSRD